MAKAVRVRVSSSAPIKIRSVLLADFVEEVVVFRFAAMSIDFMCVQLQVA